jgi:hypothetical protein
MVNPSNGTTGGADPTSGRPTAGLQDILWFYKVPSGFYAGGLLIIEEVGFEQLRLAYRLKPPTVDNPAGGVAWAPGDVDGLAAPPVIYEAEDEDHLCVRRADGVVIGVVV